MTISHPPRNSLKYHAVALALLLSACSGASS
jgi:hypothetical protein